MKSNYESSHVSNSFVCERVDPKKNVTVVCNPQCSQVTSTPHPNSTLNPSDTHLHQFKNKVTIAFIHALGQCLHALSQTDAQALHECTCHNMHAPGHKSISYTHHVKEQSR